MNYVVHQVSVETVCFRFSSLKHKHCFLPVDPRPQTDLVQSFGDPKKCRIEEFSTGLQIFFHVEVEHCFFATQKWRNEEISTSFFQKMDAPSKTFC